MPFEDKKLTITAFCSKCNVVHTSTITAFEFVQDLPVFIQTYGSLVVTDAVLAEIGEQEIAEKQAELLKGIFGNA